MSSNISSMVLRITRISYESEISEANYNEWFMTGCTQAALVAKSL